MRRALLAGLLVVAGLVLAPASPAAADTGDMFTYVVPGGATAHPEGVTLGPDTNVWFTEFDSNKVGRITVNGTVTMFSPAGVLRPRGIVAGPDGRIWFTSGDNNRIYRMQTNGGGVTHFTRAGMNQPGGITVGPDGALWFTNRGNGRIGRITTAGNITLLPAQPGLDQNDLVTHIVTGPDNHLWFNALKGNSIWRVTTGGVFTEFQDADIFGPVHPVVADGRIWFGSQNSGNIAVIDPLAGDDTAVLNSIQTYTSAAVQGPNGLVYGEDGFVWFTNDDDNSVGRIDPEAADPGTTLESFPGDTGVVNPGWMTRGADGHVWFANNGSNRMGKVETRPCNTDPLPHGYNDVPNASFYEPGLDWARCHAMVAGFSDGGFHPDDPVLRSQVINILWVMMASPQPFPAHGFVAIPASAFYNRAVRWGKAGQLIRGFPGRLYKPGDPVNRCQLSNMMWNMAGADASSPPSGYTDIPNQLYCRQAVNWAEEHGLWDDVITTGTLFDPFEPASRSQVVDVLYELASTAGAWNEFDGSFPRTIRFDV
jgi:streptogramin lyase